MLEYALKMGNGTYRYQGFTHYNCYDKLMSNERLLMAVVDGEPDLWKSDGTEAAERELMRMYDKLIGRQPERLVVFQAVSEKELDK